MQWTKWARQLHRWVSILFTVDVALNGVLVARKQYNSRLGASAAALLVVMLLSGLYLFVLPYVRRGRTVRGVAEG